MDLLTPPTDNLYKFQAIAGLLLILVSVTYPPWLYHKAIMAYLAAEHEKVQLQTQATFAQSRRDTLERRRQTLLDDPDKLKQSIHDLESKQQETSDSARSNVTAEIDRLRTRWQEVVRTREALVDASDELLLSLQLKAVQIQHQQQVSEAEMSMSQKIMYCGFGGVILGLILTFSGFRNWHRRVQVFQDAALKNQSKDRMAQAQNVSGND